MDKPTTEPVREETAPSDFIRTIVAEDVKSAKHGGRVATEGTLARGGVVLQLQ